MKSKYYDGIAENGPKAMLLELKLPTVGGLEVPRAICQDTRTRLFPVVVLVLSKVRIYG